MSRLLLLRHAKSSWADPGMADRDRPLAPRGRRAAKRMASIIADPELELLPDRVICSPARRTRETLAPLLDHLAASDGVGIADELYEPPSGHYLDAIAARGGLAGRLLLIGHNPAIQATAIGLIGSYDDGIAQQIAAKFPTGALVVIDFDLSDWSLIRPKSGRLVAFVQPRDLDKS
jgi:phosphohistidine phosphatase